MRRIIWRTVSVFASLFETGVSRRPQYYRLPKTHNGRHLIHVLISWGELFCFTLGARTLLGAPGIATRSKDTTRPFRPFPVAHPGALLDLFNVCATSLRKRMKKSQMASNRLVMASLQESTGHRMMCRMVRLTSFIWEEVLKVHLPRHHIRTLSRSMCNSQSPNNELQCLNIQNTFSVISPKSVDCLLLV